MTHYQCGSCSFQSDHLGETEQHSQQTGHVCIGKDGAGPAGGKFGKAKVLVKAGVGVLTTTAIGVLAWKYKGLQEEHEGLQEEHEELQTKHEGLLSMAAGLVTQLAESTAEKESLKSENDYLKSATGASKTLKSYDC
ncbi:hypothetical protein [Streptomyces caniscabiei]|uniref:hypothetical protein n=1 Tax=Streptomyces caniscabiei TaxID=2746961 RepID=UPI001872EC91|nr:hypothetical protein [Streptomyces caniscabiei]MBE4771254.1 hypothetical protein [Streptomyces caniscabiei]MDX2952011.1 hypothetical protein [Streptomyces caniscabiei]